MKANYKIIRAKDFIKSKPSGKLDMEQSKKVLAELASIAKPPADYEILLDVREAYTNFSFIEVFQLVKELIAHRSAFRNKIAVLVRNDYQFSNAKFAQLCATNRGIKITAFIDFEKAIDWLLTETDIDL